MMQALRIAATGMHAQQMNVDVLSNNIANLNTTGFKQNMTAFTDLVYQNQRGVGAITSDAGTLSQNFLEGSNVDSIESITRLITAQRAYELNSRVISTADEMLNTLSQLR